MNKELEQELIEKVKKDLLSLKDIKDQTETICLEAVKQNRNVLFYVKHKTDKICLEALKQDFDAISFLDINKRKIVLIALNASLHHKNKDKNILTKILKKFSKDKEIIDFYIKYKLLKYVDFSKVKLNNELIKYSMTL